MDYGHPELADRLAAEHVLGTLRGPAARRFERLLPAHPALRDAVARWQARLAPLADSVTPVEPSPRVWSGIQSALFGAERAAAVRLPWWKRLGLWQAASGIATAAVVMLLGVITVGQQPPPAAAPVLVVLAANPQVAQALQARFVASVSSDGRALVLRAIDAPPLSAQQALELWAVPGAGAPRSLGLVKVDGATTVLRTQLLRDTAAFAVSVEPAGGSPTGAPTGPIVSLGQLKS